MLQRRSCQVFLEQKGWCMLKSRTYGKLSATNSRQLGPGRCFLRLLLLLLDLAAYPQCF